MPLDILFVGEDRPGSRARQRLRALQDLGHDVAFLRSHPEGESYETPPSLAKRVRYRLRRPADRAGVGPALRAMAERQPAPDVVWIDYVLTIRPGILASLRRAWPKTKLVWYAEDDMMQRHNGSVWLDRSVPLFDLWVTTKSFNARAEEMPARGARHVLFVDNSFDRYLHRPIDVSAADHEKFGAAVSFVGTWEADRAESLRRIAGAGIPVRVWGNGWPRGMANPPLLAVEGRPVYGDDLVRVYCASAINLGFLRKVNRDLQTCRTVEIPACGAFMLHERTAEATAILAEGREAAFFAGDDELVDKCRYWLAHEPERKAVAEAGLARVAGGAFSHHDRVAEILETAMAGD